MEKKTFNGKGEKKKIIKEKIHQNIPESTLHLRILK